jgi:hypothetical protein
MRRREQARAKVAVARHVLVYAFIMLRDGIDYEEFKVRGAGRRSAARTIHRPQVPDHLTRATGVGVDEKNEAAPGADYTSWARSARMDD